MPSTSNAVPSKMPFISCPSSKNPLRCLPPELRVMVYNTTLLQPVDEMDEKLLVKDAKDPSFNRKIHNRLSLQLPSKTLHPAPELLAALRLDAELYSEALVIFYNINIFPLTRDTVVYFNRLKKMALVLIKRMSIFLTKEDTHYLTTRLTNSSRSKLYVSLRNLKHLELVVDLSCTEKYYGMSTLMVKYLRSVDSFVLRFVGLDNAHHCHNRREMYEYGKCFRGLLGSRDEREGKDWRGLQWAKWVGDVRDDGALLQKFFWENTAQNGID